MRYFTCLKGFISYIFFLDDFDCVLSFLCFVAQGTVSLVQISHVVETEQVSEIFIFSLDKTHFSSLFISLLCAVYSNFTYRMLTKVSFKFMTPQSSFYNVFYLSFLGSHFFCTQHSISHIQIHSVF